MNKQEYLSHLDIIYYTKKSQRKTQNSYINFTSSTNLNDEQNNLKTLNNQIDTCTKCELYKYRKQAISGYTKNTNYSLETNVFNPTWLIVGEAPNEHEDEQNLPFSGEVWTLLQKMLSSINVDLKDAYITNIIKCKVTHTTKPTLEQLAYCEPYLFKQIELLKPKIILAFGEVAAQALSKQIQPLNTLRGKVHNLFNAKLIVTYHPAYLLANLQEKRKAWHDLLLARQIYDEL